MQLLDLFSDPSLHFDDVPCRHGLSLGHSGVERAPATQHCLLDLFGDDRPNTPEVLADLLDLDHGAHQELKISLQISDSHTASVAGLPVPRAHEVVDEHLLFSLSVAVDPSVALL